MWEALFDHYVKTLNCSIYQDKHMCIKLSRLTPAQGAIGTHRVMWDTIELPQQGKFFHLFKLGQINPTAVGLLRNVDQWTKLSQACETLNLFANVYNNSGLELARSMVYFKTMDGSNIVFAIEHNAKNAFHAGKQDTYLRVYQNAYYNRSDSNAPSDVVAVRGGIMSNSGDRQLLIEQFNQYNAMQGECFCTVNGYRVNAINTTTTKVGDIAEFIFDGSVYKVVDFAVTNLRSFMSTMDKRAKFVLHYNAPDTGQLDYCDDCDLYVIDSTTQKGVYYYQHRQDSIRNLTHRDYSIPVDYVSSYYDALNTSSSTAVVRLYVRNSGLDTPLLGQTCRLRDLYLLDDTGIRQTLLGLNTSALSTWKAQSLETNAYIKLMGLDPNDVTVSDLAQAYGYDELCNVFAHPYAPVEVAFSRKFAQVPLLYQASCTVFEYDSGGLLLGYYPNVAGDQNYYCHNTGASSVEFVQGTGQYLTTDSGADTLSINAESDYRCYEKTNSVWKDVTGTNRYSATTNAGVTRLTWLDATSAHLVRTSDKFLLYGFDLQTTVGTYEFNLTQQLDLAGNIEQLSVPRGDLDIYLNGRLLIEGIDYLMRFPRISIISKKHLLTNRFAAQKVVVRYSGFCDTELKHVTSVSSGYVQNDMLGHNAVYDLTYRRPLRYNLAGHVKSSNDVKLAETSSDFVQQSTNNGLPYSIKTIDVSLKKMIGSDTRTLQTQCASVTGAISDYLTLKLGEPDTNQVSMMQQKYYLFSPFFCKILVDLKSGIFDEFKNVPIDNDLLRQACSHHFDTYVLDPLYGDNLPNMGYCEIHLTSADSIITLTKQEYAVLNAIVNLYGNDLIDLSSFAKIG